MKERLAQFKDKLRNSKIFKVGAAAFAGASVACTSAVNALAASSITEDMKTALSTAFTDVKTDAISIMTVALPAALSVMGIGIAITLGINFFKKFTN